MEHVLDDDPLSGSFLAERHLRPHRRARLIQDDNYSQFVAVVERTNQVWGGAADLLVPMTADGEIHEPYEYLLQQSELDTLQLPRGAALSKAAKAALEQTSRRLNLPLGSGGSEIPVMLIAAARERKQLREVVTATVPPDDIWHTSYLTVLGALPPLPDPEMLVRYGARGDLRFDEIIDVRWENVAERNLGNLAERLTEGGHPIGLSRLGLHARPLSTQQHALDGWTPDSTVWARQNGGDVVVVYQAGSVADACLLWNLRLQHGWPRQLPLGVPGAWTKDGELDVEATASRLRKLVSQVNLRGLLAHGLPAMCSSSLSPGELRSIASAAQGGPGEPEVVTAADVLVPTLPPVRTTSQVVALDHGRGHFVIRQDYDGEWLTWSRHRSLPLCATVILPNRPVVRSTALRRPHAAQYSGGGYVVPVNANDEVRSIQWPQKWTMLQARAHDCGLEVTESANGRHALALTRMVRSPASLRWLCHRGLLELLYKKAASTSMSWFKERATRLARQVAALQDDPAAAAATFMNEIAKINVSHDAETSGTLTFSEIAQVLKPKTVAEAWLSWAERTGLLRRVVPFTCSTCGYKLLQQLEHAQFDPPCPRCGRSISRPFKSSAVSFEYRLAESLRRAIDDDSVYHALIMRWLVAVLGDRRNYLVGAHPGVEFRRAGQLIGEADILVLLADGSMIPVEVKRHGAALTTEEVRKLRIIADALGSPTIMLGAGDSRSNCPADTLALDTDDGQCRIITQEYWLNPTPHATFGWADLPHPSPETVPDVTAHEDNFANQLVDAERISFGDIDPVRSFW